MWATTQFRRSSIKACLNSPCAILNQVRSYEIDTPNLAFTAMKSGVYRFDVHPAEDQTWVTVRKGYGEVTGRGTAVKVGEGQQVRFSGQNSLQHEAYAAPAPDGFDDWAKVRDKRLDDSQSARYVAPGVIGYRRSRRLRKLAGCAHVRCHLGPGVSARRMGSLSQWPLGVDCPMGMDVG